MKSRTTLLSVFGGALAMALALATAPVAYGPPT